MIWIICYEGYETTCHLTQKDKKQKKEKKLKQRKNKKTGDEWDIICYEGYYLL